MATKKTTKKTATKKAKADAKEAQAEVKQAAGNVRDAASKMGDAARHAGRSMAQRSLEAQKRAIDFQRSSFNRTFDAVNSFRERQEDRLVSWMENADRVPAEARELYQNWVWYSRTARGTFHQAVEKSFDIADGYFDKMQERVAS